MKTRLWGLVFITAPLAVLFTGIAVAYGPDAARAAMRTTAEVLLAAAALVLAILGVGSMAFGIVLLLRGEE